MAQTISPAVPGGASARNIEEPVHQRLSGRFDAGIDRLLAGPRWKFKAAIAVLGISLFRAFPGYDALRSGFVANTWMNARVKFDHPMADTSRIFPAGTHESNVTFRLTAPVLAHVLDLNRTGMLIGFGLAGAILLYLILKMGFLVSNSRRVALFVCLAIACVWPGEAAFHELRGGYYDALALCLVVAAFASSSPIFVGVFLFLAAWTDERSLICGAFLSLFYALTGSGAGRGIRTFLAGKPAAVVAAAAAYLGIRALLTIAYSYAPGATGPLGFSLLSQHIKVMPLAVWSGLAGSWILVMYGLFSLFRQKRYFAAAAFCAMLTLEIGASLMVVDLTRSMAYCLPAVFAALAALGGAPERIRHVERIAAASGVVSLIVPTLYLEGSTGLWWLYPLPVQIFRWLIP
jgi:hypothetical protein